MNILNKTFIVSALLLSGYAQAETINYNGMDISKETSADVFLEKSNKNIKTLYKQNSDFFITSKRVKADLEMEGILIDGFKEKVFPRSKFMNKTDYDNMMSDYFVNALNSGHRNLADEILFESGAKIDVNFMSNSPKKNPLLALATYNGYDGGDIEYFIKLVNMGADHSFLTKTNKVSLMGMAATVDNYKIVLYLSMLGENPMHLDGFEYYPLDYALRNDANKTILVLTNIINEYKKQIENKNK